MNAPLNCDECGSELMGRGGYHVCPQCGLCDESKYYLNNPGPKVILNRRIGNQKGVINNIGTYYNKVHSKRFHKFDMYSVPREQRYTIIKKRIINEIGNRLGMNEAQIINSGKIYDRILRIHSSLNMDINRVEISALSIYLEGVEDNGPPITINEIVDVYVNAGHRVRRSKLMKAKGLILSYFPDLKQIKSPTTPFKYIPTIIEKILSKTCIKKKIDQNNIDPDQYKSDLQSNSKIIINLYLNRKKRIPSISRKQIAICAVYAASVIIKIKTKKHILTRSDMRIKTINRTYTSATWRKYFGDIVHDIKIGNIVLQ